MPRAKRPLSEADPNAETRSSSTRFKARKLQEERSDDPVQQEKEQQNNGNAKYGPHKEQKSSEKVNDGPAEAKVSTSGRKWLAVHEEHPIDVSIAERFEKRSYMMRIIKTYNDLQVPELKELLAERALPISGKKTDLVSRLMQWDERNPSGKEKVGDAHKEALARQPVPIGAKASEMGFKMVDPITMIQRRGPNGPPVYDELGFELDYKKCTGGPRSRSAMVSNMERAVERMMREQEIKARVMGVKDTKNLHYLVERLWNDRVSKDLNIPYHKVTAADFNEWQKRGFKANPSDFDADKVTELEKERLDFLTSGSALRK